MSVKLQGIWAVTACILCIYVYELYIDGCGRTGTYILMDMVLNRMAKDGVNNDNDDDDDGNDDIVDDDDDDDSVGDEDDNVDNSNYGDNVHDEQFQYSLALVAEEVHAILKALPQ
uniref:Uncharacterized protein n=1 Tax=Octopus bimaculoides TaxID=37653 RepID=A0A0L8GIX3_OCTBM